MSIEDQNSISKMNKPLKYEIVDGLKLSFGFSAAAYYSAIAYQPGPDDLFVASYPKCGTTWMQQIVRLIYHNGEPFASSLHFHLSSPCIELYGADSVEGMERPNAIKTHLPFNRVPYSDKAKFIYVARNPRDCCVSFYHFIKDIPFNENAIGNFDDYVDLFLKGETDFGGYFHHLISWYKQSERPNILFITYEDLKRNTEREILKVAKFMGRNLENDPSLLKTIIDKSSFDYMKENHHIFYAGLAKVYVDAYHNGVHLPLGLRDLVHNLISANAPLGDELGNFFRKGKVGGWKELFTEEHKRRFDYKINEISKESDVMKLWD